MIDNNINCKNLVNPQKSVKNWKSASENGNLSEARNCFSKISISIKGVKMKLRIITKKYAVGIAIQIPIKSI